MFKQLRIIKETGVGGMVLFKIQIRDIWTLFSWKTVSRQQTLEKCEAYLCYFDGTKNKIEVIFSKDVK